MVVENDACQHTDVPATSHVSTNASFNCLVKHCRNVVLQQMCESLNDKTGLLKCIRDALGLHPESGCISAVEESVHPCEGKCTSLSVPEHAPVQNEVRSTDNMMLNESVNDINNCNVTELCQRIFLDVLMSENFSSLCSLLLENFQGMRVDKLFDIGMINSRMNDGTYESSPVLFYSDIQQFWTKLRKIGSDLIALANNLSAKSRTSYDEQVGGLLQDALRDDAFEVVNRETDMPAKAGQPEACSIYKTCTCIKPAVKDYPVCDSCDTHHVSACIKPAVKETVPRSLYCESCSEMGLPHDNCVVCKRLNISKQLAADGVDQLTGAEPSTHLEESTNGFIQDKVELSNEGKDMPCCCICGTNIESDETLRKCGNAFCSHKFYHTRCLTIDQLEAYGPCWFCPSCLCRVCLTNCDDEKIVLCDACDHAYHIYCLQPPRAMVPSSRWLCRECDADLRGIRHAKRTYLQSQNRLKEFGEGSESPNSTSRGQGKRKKKPLDKSGGIGGDVSKCCRKSQL